MNTLKLDQEQTLSYLRDQAPTYLQFEDWVRREGTIETTTLAAFNQRLLKREHIPAKLEDIQRSWIYH